MARHARRLSRVKGRKSSSPTSTMPARRQWWAGSSPPAATICLHQDVSIEEDWPGVIEATERRFGRLNVMMANARIGILCKAIEMSLADWRRQTAINLDGVFLSVMLFRQCAGLEAAR